MGAVWGHDPSARPAKIHQRRLRSHFCAGHWNQIVQSARSHIRGTSDRFGAAIPTLLENANDLIP